MKRRFGIRKISFVAGCVLILCALGLLLYGQISVSAAAEKSLYYAQTLRALMPEAESATLEEKSNNEMPILSIDGADFVGLLELPKYGAALPVCAHWSEKLRYPSRYAGSIYDGSLKIGATTQTGQFDFYREISGGDVLYFTDMTGNRYAYEVADISYRPHAENETLNREDADLTIFIKNLHAFEYVIIHCKAKV